MGSIHVLPKSAYPLKPALRRAFQNSNRVLFEIDLADQNHAQSMADSVRDGLYPKGEKLSQHLSRETLTMLKTLLPYFQISLEKIEPMRPWLVSDLLMGYYLASNGYHSELGVDYHFYELARKEGKPTGGLEKIKAQTAPFRDLNDDEADKYLRETLTSLPFTGAWFRQMIQSWETGDINSLDVLINRSGRKEKGFYKSLFDDRNSAWMPTIRATIGQKENVLIIVGSGHLVGENGIVQLLRREGFHVEQL